MCLCLLCNTTKPICIQNFVLTILCIRNIVGEHQIIYQSLFIDHKLNDNRIFRIFGSKNDFAMVLCICGQVMCLCCLPICVFMPFCEMQRNQFLSETSYFLSFFKCFILKSTLFMYSSVFYLVNHIIYRLNQNRYDGHSSIYDNVP